MTFLLLGVHSSVIKWPVDKIMILFTAKVASHFLFDVVLAVTRDLIVKNAIREFYCVCSRGFLIIAHIVNEHGQT
jgi:hypothetical protein